MTHDPFLDQPTADELELDRDALIELGGCAGILLALFGTLTVVAAFIAFAMVLR